MSKQVAIAYEYKNPETVRSFLNRNEAEKKITDLKAGIRKNTAIQPSRKMMKKKVDEELPFIVLVGIMSVIFSACGLAIFSDTFSWAWLIMSMVSAVILSLVGTVYVPCKRKLGIQKSPLLGNVFYLDERAEVAIDELGQSPVWQNKDKYPQIVRFDLKKALNNIHEAAYTVEYEFRNNPNRWRGAYYLEEESSEVLDNSEAYQALLKDVRGLEKLVQQMHKIESEWKKIEAAEKKALTVSVNNKSSVVIANAVEDNEAAVTATQDTVKRIQNDGWDADAVAVLKQKPKQINK